MAHILELSLLLSMSVWTLALPVEDFLPCKPINETVAVEKQGCPRCLLVQTTICGGYCMTKDPVFKSPFSTVYQHVCTYGSVRYETVRLPDCADGVDPFVSYPVALSCVCSLCSVDTSDCTIQSLQPDFCMGEIMPAAYDAY
ncbi:lutropin subunit beta [Engraulis encrasicolus]|uniref:Luteinizing hormone beta subunit n=1 Tax=Engraulis japonicus TaxID=42892 RepID=A2A261_ENGJA|nr:luteinizing hormone beta subunit [Engraulis japonicus]